jgi:hypothetical protein
MERFTDKRGRKKPMTSSVEAYQRLKEYEDIGLMPEQVRALVHTTTKKGESCGKDNS